MNKQLYTARQLAEILHCNPQTIYRWGYKGLIKTKKINGLRRFAMPERTEQCKRETE